MVNIYKGDVSERLLITIVTLLMEYRQELETKFCVPGKFAEQFLDESFGEFPMKKVIDLWRKQVNTIIEEAQKVLHGNDDDYESERRVFEWIGKYGADLNF